MKVKSRLPSKMARYIFFPLTLIHLLCGWQALICRATESRQALVNFDDDCRSPNENTQ